MFKFSSSLLGFVLWLESLTIGQWWAYGSAFVVLLGVVGESIADLTEWVKPERKKKRLEKASALVLILGLTGDLVAIHISQVELARVTTDVGNTRRAAEKAAEAAARTNSAAKQAEQHAREAQRIAGEAEKAAKNETLARVKIELALAPRRINQGRVASKLKQFSGQKGSIFAQSNDSETADLAISMLVVLGENGAHWNLSGFLETPTRVLSNVLVEVRRDADESTKKAAR